MKESEKKREETEATPSNEVDPGPDMLRRDFIKRFGAYSAGTCAGLFVLMSPKTSNANSDSGY